MPTLFHDGHALSESGAILVYLAERAPERGLFPSAPLVRAEVLRWMFYAATHVQPWLSLLGQARIVKARVGVPPDAGIVALAERELARFVPILDEHLAGREYLAGAYSIADVAVGCGFIGCEARGVSLAAYANLAAWRERLLARAAWSDPP